MKREWTSSRTSSIPQYMCVPNARILNFEVSFIIHKYIYLIYTKTIIIVNCTIITESWFFTRLYLTINFNDIDIQTLEQIMIHMIWVQLMWISFFLLRTLALRNSCVSFWRKLFYILQLQRINFPLYMSTL